MTEYNNLPGEWQLVVGLEIHAQVKSKSKLFSGAPASFATKPNSQVALFDVAFPGMLPVLNEYILEQAIKTGLGLNGKINKISVFDRKNYFYPDLPQGYQITQFYHPIVSDCSLTIILENGEEKNIQIERIHLEQDAGKSLHDYDADNSYIDLNRAGIALMEIVTKPDFSSIFEVTEFVKNLRLLLRYLGSCDGDMEKGSLRCDVNVSVNKPGEKLGTRCEIKNLNSIKHIAKAIEFEALRQINILENNEKITQETRLFDVDKNETRTMRSKEDANDYRYFPDPDLLPVEIDDELILRIKENMPELPVQKKDRYMRDFGLTPYDASVIINSDKETTDFFEKIVEKNNPKIAANWICAELFGRLKKYNVSLTESGINAEKMSEFLSLIENNIISGKIGKDVLDKMFETGKNPLEIVKSEGLEQITDKKFLIEIINKIIDDNQDKAEEYRNGKEKLFDFFVGQIMKSTKGKANPDLVNEILKSALSK